MIRPSPARKQRQRELAQVYFAWARRHEDAPPAKRGGPDSSVWNVSADSHPDIEADLAESAASLFPFGAAPMP